MRARLIANPVAGTDEAPSRLREINERLRPRFGQLDIVLTTGPGDSREAARDAASRGYDHLFVAGGDGTLNEAINGLAAVDSALDGMTLAILPLGTGNDFAAALGLPDDPDAALDAIIRGTSRRVDLGRVNGRFFVNVSAGGFIADVSGSLEPGLKTLTGRLAFLIGGAKVLLRTEPFECRLDGRAHSCLMFAICNAPMIGGGRLIAPGARPDDGILDACLIAAMDLLEFVALLRRVAEGTHVTDERVTYFQTRGITLEFDRVLNVNTDGEVFEAQRCEYEVLPAATTFLGAP
ncbi:MAG TPA: diacylglycerol kinase family protein [Vicinamibacterales bacterium]|nr:diacylglycerol kinase family protein [Vicinamibacterales bacterium]